MTGPLGSPARVGGDRASGHSCHHPVCIERKEKEKLNNKTYDRR